MLGLIAGFICIGAGIYQSLATRNLFNHVKVKGGESTSSFLVMGLYSSVVFTGALFVLGLYLIFVLSAM